MSFQIEVSARASLGTSPLSVIHSPPPGHRRDFECSSHLSNDGLGREGKPSPRQPDESALTTITERDMELSTRFKLPLRDSATGERLHPSFGDGGRAASLLVGRTSMTPSVSLRTATSTSIVTSRRARLRFSPHVRPPVRFLLQPSLIIFHRLSFHPPFIVSTPEQNFAQHDSLFNISNGRPEPLVHRGRQPLRNLADRSAVR